MTVNCNVAIGAECTVPKFPHYNLTNTRTIYFEGENLTVNCIAGFKLIGEAELTCSNAGNWTPHIPHCTKICMLIIWLLYNTYTVYIIVIRIHEGVYEIYKPGGPRL